MAFRVLEPRSTICEAFSGPPAWFTTIARVLSGVISTLPLMRAGIGMDVATALFLVLIRSRAPGSNTARLLLSGVKAIERAPETEIWVTAGGLCVKSTAEITLPLVEST